MRGGFVACAGGDPFVIERAAGALRAHRTATRILEERDGLGIVAFVDPAEGPVLESFGGLTRLVHGGPLEPLAALERRGTRFAALEWDGRMLRASRDPFGQAPLFYRLFGPAIWLASEVGPLLSLGHAELDFEALAARAAAAPLDERTGWTGIQRVLPGWTTEFDLATLEAQSAPYWTPERLLGTWRGTREDAVAELRARLQAAVERCCTARSAVLLSGGLDSSAVALLARDLPPGPPHLVHVQFPSLPQSHEDRYAAAVAAAVGAPLRVVQGEEARWDIDAELDVHGIPYSWLPYGMDRPALAQVADAGIEVALDGHDGDGVLGPLGGAWGTLLLEGELRRLGALSRRHGLGRVLRGIASDFVPPLLRPARLRPPAPARRIGPYFKGPLRSRSRAANDPWSWPTRRWAALQMLPLRPRATVSFEHKELEAARHGIDLRHPFADRQLVEFLVSLPCALKCDPGRPKPLLVDALAGDLPAPLRDRPKSDYMAAVSARVDVAGCVEEIRESSVRLPGVDYERLFDDARSDPRRIPVHLVATLARVHRFAARAAQPPLDSLAEASG